MRSTSIRVGAVLAVFLTVLAASGAPISAANTSIQASDQLVVGSSHTTDSELSGGYLTNVEIQGSGESASVVLPQELYQTSFEDEPADAGLPDNWEVANNPPASTNVTTSRSAVGSQSHAVTSNGGQVGTRPAEMPYQNSKTDPISIRIYSAGDRGQLQVAEGSTAIFQGGVTGGDLKYYDGSSYVTLDSAVDNGEWLTLNISNIDPASDEFTLEWKTADTSGSQRLSAWENFDEGYTTVETVVLGGTTYFDGMLLGQEAPETGQYTSGPHPVSSAEKAWANLSLSNATASIEIQAYNPSTDQYTVVNESTYSTSGNYTLDISNKGYEKWFVVAEFNETGLNPTAELHDEGILFTNHAPQADNFTPAGSTAEDQSVEFSADVSDPEFSTAQGDEVTAELFVDGTSEHTASLTQNGTVATTVDLTEGGTHDYYWTLTDSYGASTTTATQQVQVPSNLYIRNVSEPTGILNGSEFSSTVTLYPNEEGESVEITRDVSDGEISLTGLSVDSRIVAQVQEDSYYTRRTLITSIYDQQSVYLLNNNETASQVTFELADETGQYDASSSYLILRRALDLGGNTTDWQAIAGDAFDATGSFQTMLQPDVRYQLVIMNDDGDRRVIGYYDPPDRDTREQLPIGSVSIEGQLDEQGWTAGAEMTTVNETAVVGVRYYDPATETSDLTVRVYNVTGDSESLVYETSYSGPIGTHTESIDLPNQDLGGTYRVDFTGVQDGESFSGSVDVGAATPPTGFIDAIPDAAGFAIGLGAIALSGIIVVTSSSGAAVIVAAIVAELVSLLGLVPLHPVQVGVAMAIGLVYHFAGE